MEPAAEGLFTAAGVKRRRPQADGMKRPGAATHLFTAGGVKRHRPQADGAQPLAWEKRLLCGHLCDAARLEKEIRGAYTTTGTQHKTGTRLRGSPPICRYKEAARASA